MGPKSKDKKQVPKHNRWRNLRNIKLIDSPTGFIRFKAQQRENLAAQDADAMIKKILPGLLDLGESMMLAGADVNQVERLVRQVGYSYGAKVMNVLVMTASIIITITLPDGTECTQTRRIESAGETNFDKLNRLTAICHECIDEGPLPPTEFKRRLDEAKSMEFPPQMLILGSFLAASSFAVFFGGGVWDAIVSGVFSLLISLMLLYLKPIMPNTIVFDFVASLGSGIIICGIAKLLPIYSPEIVIIGDLMLLVPGVAMTNATRDVIAGDTISGVMRFIESLLWASALALGYMLALVGFGVSNFGIVHNGTSLVQLISCIPACIGFAMYFNVRPKWVPIATIGGVVAEAIFLWLNGAGYFEGMIGGIFMPIFCASIFAAVFAEGCSQLLKAPTTVFYITAVIPLIPGRGLYYTMQNFVQQNWDACAFFGIQTLQSVLGIAIGIVVVWAILKTCENISDHRFQKNLSKDS